MDRLNNDNYFCRAVASTENVTVDDQRPWTSHRHSHQSTLIMTDQANYQEAGTSAGFHCQTF